MSISFAVARGSTVPLSTTLFVPTISIVAPTFNERPNVRPLVESIGRAMGNSCGRLSIYCRNVGIQLLMPIWTIQA